MPKAFPARPDFSVGDEVSYEDHQGREQRGTIERIEAHWWRSSTPRISYTVSHPTYANRRHHTNEVWA